MTKPPPRRTSTEEIAGLPYIKEPVMLPRGLAASSRSPETMKERSMWWWTLPSAPGALERLIAPRPPTGRADGRPRQRRNRFRLRPIHARRASRPDRVPRAGPHLSRVPPPNRDLRGST